MAGRDSVIAGFEEEGEAAVRDWVIVTPPLDADPVHLQRAKRWLEHKSLERQERTQQSARHAAWAAAIAATASAMASFISVYLSYTHR